MKYSEDDRTDESNVAQSRVSDRRVVPWGVGSFLRENLCCPLVTGRIG